MSMRNRKLAILTTVVAVAALSGCAGNAGTGGDSGAPAEPRTLRVHGDLPGPFWMSDRVQTFADDVTASSDGALTLDFYPASALGISADQILQPVADGEVELAEVAVSLIAGSAPYVDFGALPMLFDSAEEARTKIDEAMPIVTKQLQEDFGVRVIAYGLSTPSQLFMRDTTYDGVESLSGQRIRTPGATSNSWIEAFGGVPTALAGPDVPEAMSTNQLDMAFNSLSGNIALDLKQFGSNVLLLDAVYAPVILIIGESTWESLSQAEQDLLTENADALTDAWFEGSVSEEAVSRTASKDAGYVLTEIPKADRAALRALAPAAWDKWAAGAGDTGAELLDIVTAD